MITLLHLLRHKKAKLSQKSYKNSLVLLILSWHSYQPSEGHVEVKCCQRPELPRRLGTVADKADAVHGKGWPHHLKMFKMVWLGPPGDFKCIYQGKCAIFTTVDFWLSSIDGQVCSVCLVCLVSLKTYNFRLFLCQQKDKRQTSTWAMSKG